MTSAHPAIVFPEKRSQFASMSEVLRKHHVGMSSQIQTVVAEFRPALAEHGVAVLGVDGRVNAYRVCRQLVFAAALNRETAAAWKRGYDLYEDLFINRTNRTPRKHDLNG